MENTVHSSKFPRALPYLFFTEFWERFGFYIVQGMLVLYMTQSFGFSDDASYTISGIFAALVYISPIAGGYLADRVLGFKTAILWGGIFLVLGYVLLASPLPHVFYISLATIIIGNGLFKPNVSSLLGTLYVRDDYANRDVGFTIFYVGINLGALLSGISAGYIKNHYGWHAGFGLASIGLMIAIATFMVGMKYIKIRYHSPRHNSFWLKKDFIILYSIVAIAFISLFLRNALLAKWLLPTFGVGLLIFLFIFAFKEKSLTRAKLLTLIILIISSIVFWMLFLQIFFSLNLFVERVVNKNWFGLSIPTTAFYSLESLFVILLGPLMAWSWQVLSEKNFNPSPLVKFIFAMLSLCVAFAVLTMSTYFSGENYLLNPLWLFVAYFLIAFGELLLSPIGLSAVTMLAPERAVGMMMGVWFVATGFGGEFAGWLAKLSNIPELAKHPMTELPIYRSAFLSYACIALGMAIVLWMVHLLTRNKLRF